MDYQQQCSLFHELEGAIPYYLLLPDKIHLWCGNEEMCHKMTAHWREHSRCRWMNRDPLSPKLHLFTAWMYSFSCIFVMLTNRWTPRRCDECGFVIPSCDIDNATPDGEGLVHLACPTYHFLPTTTGDPRNIVLIGHWDGWQPFNSSGRHYSGIHVLILNMA